MPKFDVKQDFDGALHGCYVKHFKADTTVEIDDPDLEAVALKEGWIESHVEPVAEVGEDDFPDDYAEYVVLVDIGLPEHLHEMVGAKSLGAGSEIGMSAEQAHDLIEAGLIAPKPETAEADEAKTEPEAAKAATAAPKNKAAKAAPKAKDAATE